MAHHSYAMYDRSVVYVLTGVVESINPDASHLQINFVLAKMKRGMRLFAMPRAPGLPGTWKWKVRLPVPAKVFPSAPSPAARYSVSASVPCVMVNLEVYVSAVFLNAPRAHPEAGKHCDSDTDSHTSAKHLYPKLRQPGHHEQHDAVDTYEQTTHHSGSAAMSNHP